MATRTNKSLKQKLRRGPQRIVEADLMDMDLTTKTGVKVHNVCETGRTSPKGDRTGYTVASPHVPMAAKPNGNMHTIVQPQHRSALTGRISGIKIGPCVACGHVRVVNVVANLCGVRSCVKRRHVQHLKRVEARRAKSWVEGKGATT